MKSISRILVNLGTGSTNMEISRIERRLYMKLEVNDNREQQSNFNCAGVTGLNPAAAARWRPVDKIMLAVAARGYFQ